MWSMTKNLLGVGSKTQAEGADGERSAAPPEEEGDPRDFQCFDEILAGPHEDPLNDNATPWNVVFKGVTDPATSIVLQLLRQVRPGQTLTTITLPFHILEPRSMIERISDVFLHSELLLPLSLTPETAELPENAAAFQHSFFSPSEMKTNPYWKLIALFRWFISAYKLKPEGAKKPYNSILGEVFFCAFHHGDPKTEVRYLAEQVSHHPPVSAFYAEGAGMRAKATYYPKSKLVSPNCAAGFGEGSIEMEFAATKERYTVTWPSTYVSGFVTGNTRIELGGTASIKCHTTGYELRVDFLRKGWISGSYDTIKGAVYGEYGAKTTHTVEGIWHQTISYDDGGAEFGKRVLLDSAHLDIGRPTALPLPEAHPKVCRNVWRRLTAALRSNMPKRAATAKEEVENAQRAERAQLKESGSVHVPRYFKWNSASREHSFVGEGESLADHIHHHGPPGSEPAELERHHSHHRSHHGGKHKHGSDESGVYAQSEPTSAGAPEAEEEEDPEAHRDEILEDDAARQQELHLVAAPADLVHVCSHWDFAGRDAMFKQ